MAMGKLAWLTRFNPAAQPQMPQANLADPQGVMAAAQKVADYSFSTGLWGEEDEIGAREESYLDGFSPS
jgi:hypothetical protein